MKRITTWTFAGALLWASLATTAAQAGIVIGTWDTSRASTSNTATGSFGTQRQAALATNYPGYTYATTPTLTSEFLNSGITFLSITPADTSAVPITPLSEAEQTALFNFVASGGNAFLVAEGFAPFVDSANSMLAKFGMTIADDGLTGTLLGAPTTHAHPVIHGPYGDTSSIGVIGAGIVTTKGPYAFPLATMNANGQTILAVIDRNAIAPGSGRVVITTDATLFVDSGAGGLFPSHQALYLNIVQFLVPEPTTWTLAASGAAALVFLGIKRRRAARALSR